MASVNSHLKANDSSQDSTIGGISGLKRKAVDDSETAVGESIKKNTVTQTNVQTEQPRPISCRIDHTKLFKTKLSFKSKDEAMAWVIRVGKENQTVIVKFRYFKHALWMYCERHGSATHGKKSWNSRKEVSTTSKRCNCPFSLKCYPGGQLGWKVIVVCGIHNHEVGQSVHGDANGRLTEEKNELTKELCASQCKPKQIQQQLPRGLPIQAGSRSTNPRPEIDRQGVSEKPKQVMPQIKDKDAVNVATYKKVKKPFWVEDLGGRTVLQHFLSQSSVAKQFCYKRHREAPGTDGRSSDLVFSHTDSLALLRTFPYVLIVDTTFEGNRFNTPFFEVRGVASTWENFNVACAFVAAEREENYVWALNHLKDMCLLAGKIPTTIVTVMDPDQALFNAVEQVFPDSKHLLCRRHIYNIIKDRCLKDTCPTLFLSACKILFESKTENVYEERLASMENDWKSKQELVGYLKQTWLTPYKDKIVSAWTDKVMHFGTHDTERVESHVKEHLLHSLDPSVWSTLHSLLGWQTKEISRSFEKSQEKLPGIVPRVDPFRLLQHGISHKAIEIMVQEYELVTSGDKHPNACVCQLRATHGLPCAHEMAKYVADLRPIPQDAIHEFWRQLNLDVVPNDAAGGKATPTPKNLLSCEGKLIKRPNVDEPYTAHGKPLDKPCVKPAAVIPEKTSMKPYVQGPYIHEIPNFMVPYVTDFCEYAANEHCGFQAVADAEGVEYGENGWRSVRGDLFKELASYSDLYAAVIGSDTVKKTLKALAVWTAVPLPEQRFSIPDMGHIVATQYQSVFVVLGQQCLTFLPLDLVDEADLSDSDLDELCLVSLQQGSKFIKVTMDKGFPLPPVHPMWTRHHLKSVDGLDQRYGDRFQKFNWFQSFMGLPPLPLEKM